MYELKPIIKHNIPIDLPSTMYEMKNIYGAFNGDKSNGANQDGVSPFTSHIRPDIRQQIRNVLKVHVNLVVADIAKNFLCAIVLC